MGRYCPKCRVETERYANGNCKPCGKSYNSAYRAANREKDKARHAAWYAENTEKVKAFKAAWYAENTEKVKASTKAWYAENIEKVKARHAAWRAGIPDKYVENIIYQNNELLKQVQIPPEMIEAKRAEIKLKRLIKEMQK